MNTQLAKIIAAYESKLTPANALLLKKHATGTILNSADKRAIRTFKTNSNRDTLLANVIDATCCYAYFHHENFVYVVNFISKVFTSVNVDEILSHISGKNGWILYEKKIKPYIDDHDSFDMGCRLSVYYLITQYVAAFEVLPSIPFLRMHEIFTTLGENHDDLDYFYSSGGRVHRILLGEDEFDEFDDEELDLPFDIDEDDLEFKEHAIKVSFTCDDEITLESILESATRFNGVIGSNKGGTQIVEFPRKLDAYGFIELCSIFDIDVEFTRDE